MPRTRRPPIPILRVSGLTIVRGGTPILTRMDWAVAPGEHWVILGANGSGKTSLLAALTGYLTPTAGEVELLGERYGHSDWPALRRRVGLVSSSLRQLIHPDEPALEIVVAGRYAAIDLREAAQPGDLRRARQLLRQVDASSLALRPWAVLSQGERQRVLIARALMPRPEVLILDEPCAGLDPVARERFLDFITRLGRAAHPALVLVTHHVEEILPVFRRALILRQGEVAAAGATRSVLTSGVLTHAFQTPVVLRRIRGRYALRLSRRREDAPRAPRSPSGGR